MTALKVTGYIIRADQPFTGTAQSLVLEGGTVAWSDGLTPEAYAEERGFPIEILDEAEFTRRYNLYVETLRSEPRAETVADHDYALGVLPPSGWKSVGGVEMFYVPERIIANLVSWHVLLGDRAFTFNDHASTPPDEIFDKASKALERVDAKISHSDNPSFTALAPALLAAAKDVRHIDERRRERQDVLTGADGLNFSDSIAKLAKSICEDPDPDAVFDKVEEIHKALKGLLESNPAIAFDGRDEDLRRIKEVDQLMGLAETLLEMGDAETLVDDGGAPSP